MQPIHAQSSVTGLVLAGGLATRMGGINKALVHYHGRPLVEHALASLEPQVSSVLISANRDHHALQSYGHTVLRDVVIDGVEMQAGPLLGMYSALERCSTPYLAVVPCDMPHLGTRWLGALLKALSQQPTFTTASNLSHPVKARCAYLAQQPLVCVLECELGESLLAFLQSGQRKVQAWLQAQGALAVDVGLAPQQLAHFNYLTDLDSTQSL